MNRNDNLASPPHHGDRLADAVAPFRREFIAEALDGMTYQAQGAIRFLERGEDAPAAAAMARAFDFARKAAAEMRELQGERA